MAWLQEHWSIIGILLVAVFDFLFAISPGLRANGILHAIYLFLGGKDPTPPAA